MKNSARKAVAGAMVVALSGLPVTSFAGPAEIRQCVYDICGGREVLENLSGQGLLGTLIPENLQQKMSAEFLPILNAVADADLVRAREMLSYLDKLRTATPTLNDDDKVLIGLSTVFTIDFTQAESFINTSNDEVMSVNPTALNKFLPFAKPEESKLIAGLMNAYLGSRQFPWAMQVYQKPLPVVLEILGYSDVRLLTSDLRMRVERILSHFGNYFFAPSELAVLDKAAAGKSLSILEERELVRLTYHSFLYDNYTFGDARKFYTQNFIGTRRLLEILKPRLDQIRAALASPARLKELRAQAVNRCEKRINAFVATSPSAFKLARYKILLDDVKASATRILPRYFAAESVKAAQDAIAKVEFVLPADRESAVAGLETVLAQFANDAAVVPAKLAADPVQNGKDALSSLFEVADPSNSADQILFQGLDRDCFLFDPGRATDSTRENTVLSGWQSVAYPGIGTAIAAHELGHRVSRAILQAHPDELNSPHTCTFAQHKAMYGAGAVRPELQAEEDWADTFSFSVAKDLAVTWPYTENITCALFKLDENTLEPSAAALDLSHDWNMSHSSHMFRSIRALIETGKSLPPSCARLPELQGKTLKACAK